MFKTSIVCAAVTAENPEDRNGEGETSCSQVESLLGARDGRDGRDGERGIPGERGEKGERGPIGDLGEHGLLVPVGEKGQPGEKGERGFVGLSGSTGAQGRGGEKGAKGDRGAVGVSGAQGPQGTAGQKGEPGYQSLHEASGSAMSSVECGQTYVRWGKTTCPGNQSTKLVYSGRAGGSWWYKGGGATNYVCMPDNPDYLKYDSSVEGNNYIYGVEYRAQYRQPLKMNPDVQAHNAPCAVCMAVFRCSLLMIPGKTSCPVSWTTEYVGYLMSAHRDQYLPTTYECVDKDTESVPGLNSAEWNSGVFRHVEATCSGMDSPYVAGRELTCVVCTR